MFYFLFFREVICSYLTICSCLKRRALKCWVISLCLQLWFMDCDLNSRVIWLGCFLGAISDTNTFRSFILGCLNSWEKNLPVSCLVVDILRAGLEKWLRFSISSMKLFTLLSPQRHVHFALVIPGPETLHFIFFQRINLRFLSEVEKMCGGLTAY